MFKSKGVFNRGHGAAERVNDMIDDEYFLACNVLVPSAPDWIQQDKVSFSVTS
jgi:hypothetical protein